MRLLVNSLLVVATLVALALGWKLVNRPELPTPPPGAVPQDTCDEARGPVPPVRPELSAAPLKLTPESLPVHIDGKPAGKSVPSGLHIVEAGGIRVQVVVEPFGPLLIDAQPIGELPFLLVVGAGCATCVHTETEIDFAWKKGRVGSTAGAAGALAKGDWQGAAQELRGIPGNIENDPHRVRLAAAITWLAGQSNHSRGWLSALPKDHVLTAALVWFNEEEKRIGERQLATSLERWNALTERYERLSDAFVSEAPQVTSELTRRFKVLSEKFVAANTAARQPKADPSRHAVELELLLQDASVALGDAVSRLRSQRSDCAWQRKLWAAL